MIILIIDDDLNKMRQLSSFIKAKFQAEVWERRSYQSGLESALLEKPDVILLDMTMPTFDVGGKEKGGRERRYAGQQILRQLKRKKINIPVIIVTQFERFGEGNEQITLEELKKSLKLEFVSIYIDTIYYQAGDSKWMDELRTNLLQIFPEQKREE